MKTIATLLILFCGITFSNAQEKKLPNKEETYEYLNKMIKEGREGEYVSGNSNYVTKVRTAGANYYSYSLGYVSYIVGEETGYCNNHGMYQSTETYDKINGYSNMDFNKLMNVEQKSKSVSNATVLQIKVTFNGDFIDLTTSYKKKSSGSCYLKDEKNKVNYVFYYIPNEEGSFDRFKKALFHYKDLLIAEQKQKIADDPFAN